MKKIFSVSDDDNHIACFETKEEAVEMVNQLHLRGHRYADYIEDEYQSQCDCGNQNISEEFEKSL